MRLLNLSRISDRKIKKLAKFVSKKFPKEIIALTEIHILNSPRSPTKITGTFYCRPVIPREVYKISPNVYCTKPSYCGEPISPKTTYFIVINIGIKRIYPHAHPYKISVGTPVFKSFEEDFICALGHELQHAKQECIGETDPAHYEVDAERVSHEILEDFRKAS